MFGGHGGHVGDAVGGDAAVGQAAGEVAGDQEAIQTMGEGFGIRIEVGVGAMAGVGVEADDVREHRADRQAVDDAEEGGEGIGGGVGSAEHGVFDGAAGEVGAEEHVCAEMLSAEC